MFTFLLIVQTLVAASLVAVILMQRSEGGGLGVGGSSSGFMTARGAADFLTRATSILGALFIILSIGLAALAGVSRAPAEDRYLAGQPGRAGFRSRRGAAGSGRGSPAPAQPATGNQDRAGGPARPITSNTICAERAIARLPSRHLDP